MIENAARDHLTALFKAAVNAADAETCVPPALPDPPREGRLIILAAGKGAAAMVRAAERHYLAMGVEKFEGLAVTRHGAALPTQVIELIEAGHPVPDANSVTAATRALELAQSAGEKDLVLVLLSGGASALWTAPVEGLTLADKQAITRRLLASGAPISEMNCIRKHISRIKGGGLAKAAARARLVTLAVSDVPGDDPSTIGSGPTVGDASTLQEALAILRRRGVPTEGTLEHLLTDARNETPAPDDPIFERTRFEIVARPAGSLAEAAEAARLLGYEPELLGDSLEGEARDVARAHAAMALDLLGRGRRVALLSGGELTVTITGDGRGGPNQEYCLALAVALEGKRGIAACAADTDGADGGGGAKDDPAGAIIDSSTLERAKAAGLDPAKFLENNDSTGFFARLGDLLITGPTHTNVNDFRAILIDP
jgi:hydroxypyruvate reductase